MSYIKSDILFYTALFLTILFVQSCAGTQKMEREENRNLPQAELRTAELDSSYIIKIGDEIEVSVWEESDFNTTTTVSNMGTIVIPLVGEIEAAGKTQKQLKDDLRQHLSKYIKNEINLTVAIRSTESMLVSVLGMVIKPDNYPVVEGTSILKILSMAGGTTEEANINNVRIYRENSNPGYTELDVGEMLDNGEINSAAKVYPGDVIYVPPREKRENVVREVAGFLRDAVILFGIFRVIN